MTINLISEYVQHPIGETELLTRFPIKTPQNLNNRKKTLKWESFVYRNKKRKLELLCRPPAPLSLLFLYPLRNSGNWFHFKQQRLLNRPDPICLRFSFPPEHPPPKKKTFLTKGCLSCQEFSTFLALADIFLFYKGPFGKFPLIAGFSPALIGGIHSTVWLGRVLDLESEKGRLRARGLSDLETFQIGPNRGRLSKGDHNASAVALYPGDVWLVFPTSTSSLTEHVAFIHGSGRGCSYWVARLWGPPLVRESLDKFASSNQAECFFMFPVFVEFLSAALRRLCSSKGFFFFSLR